MDDDASRIPLKRVQGVGIGCDVWHSNSFTTRHNLKQVGEVLQKALQVPGQSMVLAKFPDGGGMLSCKCLEGAGLQAEHEHRLVTESFCVMAEKEGGIKRL